MARTGKEYLESIKCKIKVAREYLQQASDLAKSRGDSSGEKRCKEVKKHTDDLIQEFEKKGK